MLNNALVSLAMHANMRLKWSARRDREREWERESARSFDILVSRLIKTKTTASHAV